MSDPQSKLLYVESDPQVLQSSSSLLTDNGYEVSTAATLTKALRLFRSFPFDLLVIGRTVAPKERTALAAISKRINPKASVLVIVGENEKQPLSDGWLTSHKESDLLDAVASLLNKPSRASAMSAA